MIPNALFNVGEKVYPLFISREKEGVSIISPYDPFIIVAKKYRKNGLHHHYWEYYSDEYNASNPSSMASHRGSYRESFLRANPEEVLREIKTFLCNKYAVDIEETP